MGAMCGFGVSRGPRCVREQLEVELELGGEFRRRDERQFGHRIEL